MKTADEISKRWTRACAINNCRESILMWRREIAFLEESPHVEWHAKRLEQAKERLEQAKERLAKHIAKLIELRSTS
jgi:predicted translin family RNA/ssDNA-binding protein